MSKPIIQLPEHLANLIAAGEVVERPLSVVKELVENSLDAESTSIKITLENAGLKYIAVLDDGTGMSNEQIPMALKRHATSKITSVDDLFSIVSLGFRGEALPSIASVSRLIITSKSREITDNNFGYFYEYLYGKQVNHNVTSFPYGTQVEIFNLFENTPARYKNLASPSTELSHIVDYVEKAAIAHPDCQFTIINNQKTIFSTSGQNELTVAVSEVFGAATVSKMITFENHNNLYQISGLTTSNEVYKSNRQSLIILVNGRVIRSLNLSYGIIDAYKTILPIGKYPITILKISCEPSVIDVNVHPSKLEIRFTDETSLRQLVTKTIQHALSASELLKYEKKTVDEPEEDIIFREQQSNVPQVSFDKLWDALSTTPEVTLEEECVVDNSFTESVQAVQPKLPLDQEERKYFQYFHYIGQFHKTYLILSADENLYLIDQHAAMERVMYERILNSFRTQELHLYDLLVPIIVDLNHSTIITLLEKTEELKVLGLTVEQFGPTSVIVRSVPTYFPKGLEVDFIHDIFNHVMSSQKSGQDVMLDSLAKQLSCKQSIKANMSIRSEEVAALLKDLDACEMPYTCPHGRPTLVSFTLRDLEKLFKRVM